VSPARNTLSARANVPLPPEPQPIVETEAADDLNIALDISPGWVGANTFSITLTDAAGAPVEDASRIRLRFENAGQGVTESELRPEHQGGGVYTASGANLSAAGEWRIRMTVQRPERFDAVLDFRPAVRPAPSPVMPPPLPDNGSLLPERAPVLLGLGVVLALAGAAAFVFNRAGGLRLSHVLAAALLLVGGGFVAAAQTEPVSEHGAGSVVFRTELTVDKLWKLPNGVDAYSVYATITNPTAQPERLVDVDVMGAQVYMLHQTTVDDAGTSEMHTVEWIEIPPNNQVYLAPGGYHLMLEGVADPTATLLTFTFESGKQITVPLNMVNAET
jgi:copper(I)-binding protein